MLSNEKGIRITDDLNDYVVFDLETTGLNTDADKIVEIAAIRVRSGESVEEFQTLVNPGIHIPYTASSISGITDDMVIDAPDTESALEQFIDFIGNDCLVGHNIHSFDLKFIYREIEYFFGRTLDNNYVDSLLLSKRKLPKMKHNLSILAEYYQINNDGAHRALADCRMNQKIYEFLKNEPDPDNMRVCPVCKNILTLREGKYGKFWGCSGFPDCRYTERA